MWEKHLVKDSLKPFTFYAFRLVFPSGRITESFSNFGFSPCFLDIWNNTEHHDIKNAHAPQQESPPPQASSPLPLNKSLKNRILVVLDCDLHYSQHHWSPALVSIPDKLVFLIFSNLCRILNIYAARKSRSFVLRLRWKLLFPRHYSGSVEKRVFKNFNFFFWINFLKFDVLI